MTLSLTINCLGKFFNSVINDRFHSFLETNNSLGTEQLGFTGKNEKKKKKFHGP